MIGGLKPYPEYKEPGVAWLGRIPKNWRVLRGKSLFPPNGHTLAHWAGRATHTELFKQFQDNAAFKKWLGDTIFLATYSPGAPPESAARN